MLSVKQGSIKCHFLSLWYESSWYWTQVSRAIAEHSKSVYVALSVQLDNLKWILRLINLMSPLAHEVLLTSIVCDFFCFISYCNFYFIEPFWLLVSISYLSLYLICSLFPFLCTASLKRLILQWSSLSMILTSFQKGKWFSFSFNIWSAIPDFFTSSWHTALALLLVGGMSCLCILYHNCMGWSTLISWSYCILLEA